MAGNTNIIIPDPLIWTIIKKEIKPFSTRAVKTK
jgi:hypothetical protein